MKPLVFLCLAAVAYGQQCGSEFEQFRSCVQKEDGNIPPAPKPFPEGSVSNDVSNCFTSSGCQAPTLPGAAAAASESLMWILYKCSDEVKDEMKPMIQQCMTTTPNVGPGFILHPDLIAPLPLTMPNPPPAPPAAVIVHSAAQVYNDHICPTASEKSRARSCVINVSKKFIPVPETGNKSPIETAFDLTRHCYNQEVCKTRMSPTCKQDLENMRAYLCNCAKQVFATQSNIQQLVDNFKSCVTREAGAAALQKQSVITFTTYAQRLVTNLMCLKAPDPCKPPEVPQQPGQPQPGHPGQG